VSIEGLRRILYRTSPFVDATEVSRAGGHIVSAKPSHALILDAIAQDCGAGDVVLIVTATSRDSDQLRDALRSFGGYRVWDLPAWETLPHERLSPHPQTVAKRLSVFRELSTRRSDSELLVVVTSIRALLQPVNDSVAAVSSVQLRRGTDIGDISQLVQSLVDLGYRRVDLVTRRGDFAVRGGIVDVFSPLDDHPVRADLFGSVVDELAWFDVTSQRSLPDTLEALDILPARELLLTDRVKQRARELRSEFPGLETMLEKISQGIAVEGMESLQPILASQLVPVIELFPPSTRILELGPERTIQRAHSLVDTHREFLEAAWAAAAAGGSETPISAEAGNFFSRDQVIANAGERPWTSIGSLDSGSEGVVRLPISDLAVDRSGGESIADLIRSRLSDDYTVVVAAKGIGLVHRALDVLGEWDIAAAECHAGDILHTAPVVSVIQATIDDGWEAADQKILVIGEAQFFGQASSASARSQRTLASKRREGVDPLELAAGDLVVHDTHGIGRFVEVVERPVSTGGRDAKVSTREFVVLEYAPSKRGHPPDKLYVPTDQLDVLSRYVGGDNPALSKMGGAEWSAAKSRARKAVRDIAVDLVKLYSARMSQPGYAFSPDSPFQRELEEAFPFMETADQLTTIDEVKADMERPIPMDRLIAGDVGFGKTEIAVRAAFKAVHDNKQVVVLAPTTLLVAQHAETFQERFAPFGVRLASLSRFTTTKEAQRVLEGLADGSVDVVIGTHRLLSDQIRFKDLGLVIVDEEQRFGVEHKDRLKKLRTNVDMLAMSATPIPRTLEMAVTGIREMSTLHTPPENRHPILSYVGAANDQQIQAAIRRELLREGQVFYVHNRVAGIHKVASRVSELVPEARVAVAHGQLPEAQLEQIMLDFYHGDYDVLVSTTIIETGIDVSNANTLIVDRADRFGLAQLHQLRGRVGRGRERAYAYFLFDPEDSIGETAIERLETLAANSDLGGGMRIAMKDLELRGAGNLLGAEQAGHIQGVGFDLYLRMMAEAIGTFRGDVAPEQTELRLELPVDARIPSDYIDSDRLRLEAYQKLSQASAPASSDTDIDAVVDELVDRYGQLPTALATLVMVTRLRRLSKRAGLSEVLVMGSTLRVVGPPLPDSMMVRLKRLYPQGNYLAPARVVLIPLPDYSDQALVTWVEGVIESLYGSGDSPAASETLTS
jgi:transcription-repair coupling factor (superfamily II helicase)